MCTTGDATCTSILFQYDGGRTTADFVKFLRHPEAARGKLSDQIRLDIAPVGEVVLLTVYMHFLPYSCLCFSSHMAQNFVCVPFPLVASHAYNMYEYNNIVAVHFFLPCAGWYG